MTAITATVVYRALSSPMRARLMEVLRSADAPMSAQDLAREVDLHPNTVRSHPAVACSFHQGLVRGLLDVLGGGYELAELDTDVDRGPCRMMLRMVA